MTEKLDLDRLQALAETATPGPWMMTTQGGIEPANHSGPGEDFTSVAQARSHRDWEFIAAFNPATVLALIALARRAEETLASAREYGRRYGRMERTLARTTWERDRLAAAIREARANLDEHSCAIWDSAANDALQILSAVLEENPEAEPCHDCGRADGGCDRIVDPS